MIKKITGLIRPVIFSTASVKAGYSKPLLKSSAPPVSPKESDSE